MSDIKITSLIVVMCLSVLALWSCSDDIMERGSGSDGKYTIEITKPSPLVAVTRAEDDNVEEETVGSVAVFVFGSQGQLTNSFVEHSTGNIRYIDIYLTDSDMSVYAVCNYPSPEALLAKVDCLEALMECTYEIDRPEGAHPGYYVMSGHTTVESIRNGDMTVPVYRLSAHLDFTISVDTSEENGGDGGEFKMTSVNLCNLPMGSFLFDRSEKDGFGEEGCGLDYAYDPVPDKMRAKYFGSVRLNVKDDGNVWLASYDMLENRRGSMPDRPEVWPELNGLESYEKYEDYKQLFKRVRAKDYPDHIGQIVIDQETSNEELDLLPQVKKGRFYNASYLRIDGVYMRTDGTSYKTSYYVYLGEDNYRDFNVRRNYQYSHEIIIRAYDYFDHRVSGELLDGVAVFADFSELDAHCNVVKALIYSPEEWTVSVKNPDLTPWLEVSHYEVYKPRIAGKPLTGREAEFAISGKSGLNYFYVHTDEYIPEISNPGENVTMLQGKKRRGTIVCRSKNITKEYEIVQLPAQIVILHINYDVHTMKEVCDTFYIERKLEQKYMPWGFMHYWSYQTDDLIVSGTWDGLSNTRKLYDVALNGEKDKNGKQIFDPAYPDGLSSDHALGYVVSKNRDRNGNGRIDYNEIVWYWPATKELEQIRNTKFNGLLDFEGWNEIFYASTPSSSDKLGITPGLAVRLKMEDDSPWLPVRRDRKYNVISCRRKNAWKGPQTGSAGGNVANGEDWGGNDEVIIPK